MAAKTAKGPPERSLWLAANPSKRWAEVFYLAYSPFWIAWALCVLVPFQLYEVSLCVAQVAASLSGRATACGAVHACL
jgi:hypothetical protein